jgi:hypothetical protein
MLTKMKYKLKMEAVNTCLKDGILRASCGDRACQRAVIWRRQAGPVLKCIAAPVPTGEHAMETGAPSAGGVNNHI